LNAVCGTTMTALAGVGRRVGAAHGGAVTEAMAATAEVGATTLATIRVAIDRRIARFRVRFIRIRFHQQATCGRRAYPQYL
jgi:hypothetical protein